MALDLFNYDQIIKMRKSFSPDLILSQYHAYHYASVVGGYLSKFLKIPHVIRSHDIFLDLKSQSAFYKLYILANYPQIYRSILKSNRFYVTTSEMVQYFQNFKKMRDVDFKVHHNGIDTQQFYPYKNQDELKEKYSCENIILFMGLMSEDIGVHNLIKAFPGIIRHNKDTHMILLGDGPYRNYI